MKLQKEKVILTGFRATGKSSVGKTLAKRLGFDFVDTDKAIEMRQGETIAEMVARGGWELFRSKEKEILQELVVAKNLVIAAGGGAVMHEEAWAELRKNSLAVWLTASPETICARLAEDSATEGQRPSLTDKGTMNEIAMVLKERQELYREGSDLSLSTEGRTPLELAEIIFQGISGG
jgi:shikimate kinase